MAGSNTLAYYDAATIMGVKSFNELPLIEVAASITSMVSCVFVSRKCTISIDLKFFKGLCEIIKQGDFFELNFS